MGRHWRLLHHMLNTVTLPTPVLIYPLQLFIQTTCCPDYSICLFLCLLYIYGSSLVRIVTILHPCTSATRTIRTLRMHVAYSSTSIVPLPNWPRGAKFPRGLVSLSRPSRRALVGSARAPCECATGLNPAVCEQPLDGTLSFTVPYT